MLLLDCSTRSSSYGNVVIVQTSSPFNSGAQDLFYVLYSCHSLVAAIEQVPCACAVAVCNNTQSIGQVFLLSTKGIDALADPICSVKWSLNVAGPELSRTSHNFPTFHYEVY